MFPERIIVVFWGDQQYGGAGTKSHIPSFRTFKIILCVAGKAYKNDE